MIYKNTAELKSKIVQIMNSTDKNSKYYNDLKWFSNINYTTTTEYFGELKLFLLDIVNLDEFKHYKSNKSNIKLNICNSYLENFYRQSGQPLCFAKYSKNLNKPTTKLLTM